MNRPYEKMEYSELELQCAHSMLEICRRVQGKPFLLQKAKDACVLMKEVSLSLENQE